MSTPAQPYGELVRQYLALRESQPGVLLLFRIGSFYEVFFEDAELLARELGLKLSDRPSGGSAPPVPQCGFAHHALDDFLPRLLARGYRVAIGDEGADAGGPLRQRTIIRTLTPGTITDPALLHDDRPTYLVALVATTARVGLAWTDVAAGEFRAGEFSVEGAAAEVQRLAPAEVLVPADVPAPAALVAQRSVTTVPASADARAALQRAYPDADLTDLPLAADAAGLIARYLATLQGAATPPLDVPTVATATDGLRLDAATQRHLELVETEHGRAYAGSLLATLDRTVTPMGRRMLRAWLLRPLTDLAKIAMRQRIIGALVAEAPLRHALATALAELADLERLAGRAAARRATPEDLRSLATVAAQLPRLSAALGQAPVPFLRALGRPRPTLTAFAARVAAVLPPTGAAGTVRPDASPTLAAAATAVAAATAWQAAYVARLRQAPGLSKVKLERTSTQGLFLEVPVNTPVPADWSRRGGLKSVERYSTTTLDEHAIALADAEATVASETQTLLTTLRDTAMEVAASTRDLARYLAAADAALSLAVIAGERGWVCPVLDEGPTLHLVGGRHPVLDATGCRPNDATLHAGGPRDQLVVLTGPNMAGKSTWMRQIALLTLLAQIGAFVPATALHLGLVDAIYTRIGAVDDVGSGRSTFMVEMLETAAVLDGATTRSLVLLDELGRGTSTHDGMAIAWAVIDHLVSGPARPRAIVATHYHELAALAALYPAITLLRAAVEQEHAGIRFPHRIEPGAAEQSYGIEVARLAGLPASVLARATTVAAAIAPVSAALAARLREQR